MIPVNINSNNGIIKFWISALKNLIILMFFVIKRI